MRLDKNYNNIKFIIFYKYQILNMCNFITIIKKFIIKFIIDIDIYY